MPPRVVPLVRRRSRWLSQPAAAGPLLQTQREPGHSRPRILSDRAPLTLPYFPRGSPPPGPALGCFCAFPSVSYQCRCRSCPSALRVYCRHISCGVVRASESARIHLGRGGRPAGAALPRDASLSRLGGLASWGCEWCASCLPWLRAQCGARMLGRVVRRPESASGRRL